MKTNFKVDPWCLIEEGWDPEAQPWMESLFSIGNGRFGQRANFEEFYSGPGQRGSFVAGVYARESIHHLPEKLGSAQSTEKIIHAHQWSGIDLEIEGEKVDLHDAKYVGNFKRVLDMRRGVLERTFSIQLKSGKSLEIQSRRFCSMANRDIAAIQYSIKALNFSDTLTITPYLDANPVKKLSKKEQSLWLGVEAEARRSKAFLLTETKGTGIRLGTGMQFQLFKNNLPHDFSTYRLERDKFAGCQVEVVLKEGETLVLEKYVAVRSSQFYKLETLIADLQKSVKTAQKTGFSNLLEQHQKAWEAIWDKVDIQIEGDEKSQQGIRFNIFQLYQTFTGYDDGVSIGGNGFTGKRRKGLISWDTEIFCLPFYLMAGESRLSRKLLEFRFHQLEKAYQNALLLGMREKAALFPMVTLSGEECHPQWEIAMGAVHRNAAIVYAIREYLNYTNDYSYLGEGGLAVLIGIARFWTQRVHWSEYSQSFMIHGVVGPNEYETNVSNNWYTNYMAVWCLQFGLDCLEWMEQNAPERFEEICDQLKFYKYTETRQWKTILEKMYLPEDLKLGIFVQQDGYLDKTWESTDQIPREERPIFKHWSWDRVLRSCYLQKADVLQGIYMLEENFSPETLRQNFDFYEERTLHESGVSPAVHAVLACRLGDVEKAYAYFLKSARLDLDDLLGESAEGCHITSMAATWLATVKGFGGFSCEKQNLKFNPILPAAWKALSFCLTWRNSTLKIRMNQEIFEIENLSDSSVPIVIFGKEFELKACERLIQRMNHIV